MPEQQPDHEVVKVFEQYLHPLCAKLVEMLNDHFSHQTERRGCGYTQATRLIAEYINIERDPLDFHDFTIFEKYDTTALKQVMREAEQYGLTLTTWRNLDQNPDVVAFLQQQDTSSPFYQALQQSVEFQQTLRQLHQYLKLEESFLIVNFIEDIILPKSAEELQLINLKHLAEKPKVGSCTMAENFFLKISYHKLLRQGRINIFVDDHHRPLMMEKIKMGDDHSCISLAPMILHGIRIPVASLFSVAYEDEKLQRKANRHLQGDIIPIEQVIGFWFLRVTTLAISPENRQRTFTTHYKQQIQQGLFNPETTLITQLIDVVKEQF